MEKLKVIGIAGSIRKGSNNKRLLRSAIGLAPENMLIEEFDIKEIPMYNPDLEKEALPGIVAEFKKKIRESDGILIATPEYNYSIPGALKNAIDWASRTPADTPLSLKPLAIMGGSGGMSGTIRAQGHLRQIVTHSNMMDMKKPEVLVTMIQDKFDEKGSLIDEKLKMHLVKFLSSFENWINQFKNKK
jgi:chromate reductase